MSDASEPERDSLEPDLVPIGYSELVERLPETRVDIDPDNLPPGWHKTCEPPPFGTWAWVQGWWKHWADCIAFKLQGIFVLVVLPLAFLVLLLLIIGRQS